MPLLTTEAGMLEFLTKLEIPFERVEHPPVYTCEEADRYRPGMDGVSTKNLLLRDRRGRYFLVMTDCETSLDLKALGRQIGASKLHFASAEQLENLLGVTPGAVTVLGLANDRNKEVALLVDGQIWDGAAFLCHPLVNTATLVLRKDALQKFLAVTGHEVSVFQPAG